MENGKHTELSKQNNFETILKCNFVCFKNNSKRIIVFTQQDLLV